jgi:hypothetical protein
MRGGSPDPVCKGGAIQLDALPGVDLRLPIKRQVISIFCNQHPGEQGLGGNAYFDNMCWCRGLDDRALTGAAPIARPTGDQNAERGGDDIEPLGDIFADLV